MHRIRPSLIRAVNRKIFNGFAGIKSLPFRQPFANQSRQLSPHFTHAIVHHLHITTFTVHHSFPLSSFQAKSSRSILIHLLLLGRVALVTGVAGYSHQTFPWTICRSASASVCPVHCVKRRIGSGCRLAS